MASAAVLASARTGIVQDYIDTAAAIQVAPSSSIINHQSSLILVLVFPFSSFSRTGVYVRVQQ